MAVNNNHDTAFVKVLTCSDANQKEDMLLVRTHVTLVASGACFVNFDKAVTAEGRFRLVADTPVSFDISFSQLNYMADTGTPTIHVIASRQ